MIFGQLIFRYLPLTLLALSPIFVCLFLTRKNRRTETNQAIVIICLAISLGLILRLLGAAIFSLIQLLLVF